MMVSMLTTTDNPFDPFDQYDEWLAYDAGLGHHTPAYLARIGVTSNELSDYDQALAIDRAIDDIIKENGDWLYKKVTRDAPDIPDVEKLNDGGEVSPI